MTRRTVLVATPAVLGVLALPALGAWVATGSGGASTAADRLLATTDGSVSSATSSSLRLTWRYPSTGLQPSGWAVFRGGLDISTSCAYATGGELACVDAGLAPSTTYDYSVAAKRGEWRGEATRFSGSTAARPVVQPAVAITSPVAGATTSTTPVISGTASDSSTVTVSLTAGTTTRTLTADAVAASSGYTWSVAVPAGSPLQAGTRYTAVARQTNAAGTGTSGSVGFTTAAADTTPPTVSSIVRRDAATTNAPSVAWTVTFSEPVTGVDKGDLALTTSGVSGATVGGVEGSGATWVVTAGTGTGSGTLRLDVVDDDSIVDSSGNRLGGSGTGNGGGGGSRTGEAYTLDRTGPTATAITSTDADGTAEPGDTLSVTFDEALLPGSVAPSATATFNRTGNDNTSLSIPGLTAGAVDTGTRSWTASGTAVSYSGSLRLASDGRTITFTVASLVSGTPVTLTQDSAQRGALAFSPSPELKDALGNAAGGTTLRTAQSFKVF